MLGAGSYYYFFIYKDNLGVTNGTSECEKPGTKDGWCLYENEELGFSFEYPADDWWKLFDGLDDPESVPFLSLTKDYMLAPDGESTLGSMYICVYVDQCDTDFVSPHKKTEDKDVTVNGLKMHKQVYKESDGDADTNDIFTVYVFSKGGTTYTFRFNVSGKYREEHLSLFTQVVNSFEIIK